MIHQQQIPVPPGTGSESLSTEGFIKATDNPCYMDPSEVRIPTPTPPPTETVESETSHTCPDVHGPQKGGVWNNSWWNVGLVIYDGYEFNDHCIRVSAPSTGYDEWTGPNGTFVFQSWQDNYTLNSEWGTASLIARIDGGEPIFVGERLKFIPSEAGMLELGINDTDPGNNEGSFSVEVCWGWAE